MSTASVWIAASARMRPAGEAGKNSEWTRRDTLKRSTSIQRSSAPNRRLALPIRCPKLRRYLCEEERTKVVRPAGRPESVWDGSNRNTSVRKSPANHEPLLADHFSNIRIVRRAADRLASLLVCARVGHLFLTLKGVDLTSGAPVVHSAGKKNTNPKDTRRQGKSTTETRSSLNT